MNFYYLATIQGIKVYIHVNVLSESKGSVYVKPMPNNYLCIYFEKFINKKLKLKWLGLYLFIIFILLGVHGFVFLKIFLQSFFLK